MRFDNRFIVIIIGAIGLYSIFLMSSDFNTISNQFSRFELAYLPLILLIIPLSWLALSLRWILLLRNSNTKVGFLDGCKICVAGFCLAITPGKLGEFIKVQLMKRKFDTPIKTTGSLVIVERIYDLVGAVIASFFGIWLLFDLALYVLIAMSVLAVLLFIAISSRRIFNVFLQLLGKIKFLSKTMNKINESYEIIKASCRGKIVIYCSLLSVSVWLLESLGVYYVFIALSIDSISYLHVIPMYSFSIILGAVSLIPGGLGVAEGSMASLLNYYGLEIGIALGIVVLIRIFTLWYSVIAGFISLKLTGGISFNKEFK